MTPPRTTRPRIVALVPDLMDRSRLAGVGTAADVTFAADAAGCGDADVVVVDLVRHAGLVATVRALAPQARIVAFGPHVDHELLEGARRDGADVVLARSQFLHDPVRVLTGTLPSPSAAGGATMDTTVTDHLLSTTRAVRRRLDLDRPVERAVILDCLRLAQQAPTGGNLQGWSWIVVTDPDTRAALAELYARGASESFVQGVERALRKGNQQTAAVYSSAQYLLDVLARVPVHVIPCIRGRADGAANAFAAPFYGSILPAVWSFMLALRSRGLGSVWTTVHLAHEQEAAALLGIPDDVTQVALVPVAYTTGGDFRPADRPPVEQITHWDRWGTTET